MSDFNAIELCALWTMVVVFLTPQGRYLILQAVYFVVAFRQKVGRALVIRAQFPWLQFITLSLKLGYFRLRRRHLLLKRAAGLWMTVWRLRLHGHALRSVGRCYLGLARCYEGFAFLSQFCHMKPSDMKLPLFLTLLLTVGLGTLTLAFRPAPTPPPGPPGLPGFSPVTNAAGAVFLITPWDVRRITPEWRDGRPSTNSIIHLGDGMTITFPGSALDAEQALTRRLP